MLLWIRGFDTGEHKNGVNPPSWNEVIHDKR
jgi:hypothetical protein